MCAFVREGRIAYDLPKEHSALGRDSVSCGGASTTGPRAVGGDADSTPAWSEGALADAKGIPSFEVLHPKFRCSSLDALTCLQLWKKATCRLPSIRQERAANLSKTTTAEYAARLYMSDSLKDWLSW